MAKNTGAGSRHANKERHYWYSHREILDPYRMEAGEQAALERKLRAKLPDEYPDPVDIFVLRRVWASCAATLALTITWGFIIQMATPGLFFGVALPLWAVWWVYYIAQWPLAKRNRAKLEALRKHEPIDYAYEGYAVSLYNVAESLRSLPRELREAHRPLWDSALAAHNVLKYGEDADARNVLETAEDRAVELKRAQAELIQAVEADKRSLEFQAARAALSSSTLHAHEAAHADAQALLEGARSMREMTRALSPKAE